MTAADTPTAATAADDGGHGDEESIDDLRFQSSWFLP